MNNLTLRILVALLAIPLFLGMVFFDFNTRILLMALLMGVGSWELARMTAKKIEGPSLRIVSPLVTLGFVGIYAFEQLTPFLSLYCAFAMCLYVGIAFASVKIEKLFDWLCLHLFNPLFLGLWMGQAMSLFGHEEGYTGGMTFLFVASCMWFCDSFAYFTGKLIGKHKLAPAISPKKTWEGSMGGVFWTLIYAACVGTYMTQMSLANVLVLAFVLSITAQVGDLLMSAAKRFTETKDSSHLIPGHGGILDRFDSLYLSAPIAAVLIPFLNKLSLL